MKKLGIYIHVPFCKQKCNYCDFYSIKWDNESENKYIAAIINEIKGYKDTLYNDYIVDTIFFGGGTPTIVKPEILGMMMDCLKEVVKIDKDCEITTEANPNTLSLENLEAYKNIGINRVSIGIQSLNDTILKEIGRIHNSVEALEAIDRAKSVGFENINVDVMFNIPGQTVKDIEDTIYKITEKNVKHISFYSLKLEKGTPLYIMEQNNKVIMPDEDIEREMYYSGRNIMEQNNLYQYEISNFADEGFECKHNLKYWNQEEYIGFGPSAHSFLNNVRYSNPQDLKLYCEKASVNNFKRIIHEELNTDNLMFEYIMLQLRLTKGLDLNEFNYKFTSNFNKKYKQQIDYLLNNSLVELKNNHIMLTKTGMDIANFVIEKFM